jgi:hypothetical protein
MDHPQLVLGDDITWVAGVRLVVLPANDALREVEGDAGAMF